MRLFWFYLKYLKRLLLFYVNARTIYDIHSPFVASFLQIVVYDRRRFYGFTDIELFRRILRKNRYRIYLTDYGAGSKANPSQWREIRDIVRHGAVSPTTGRYLFRTVLFQNPSNILELGTSLGISTLYLRMAGKASPFITLEGCPETAGEARNNLLQMGYSDVKVVTGPFSETLPLVLACFPRLDLLYLDGDHRAAASYGYFLQCLEKAASGTIFIVADIHWSTEMEASWARMRAHPRVRGSLDLFRLGFLFFDERLTHPVHADIVPWIVKPWRSGIFG